MTLIPADPTSVLSPKYSCCHSERTGPRTFFSSGVPEERSLLFGVEFGGGESKNLRLFFDELQTRPTSASLTGQSLRSPGSVNPHLNSACWKRYTVRTAKIGSSGLRKRDPAVMK